MVSVVEIGEILSALAEQRPVFHSEADFQHAFAWEIHQQLPMASVRLELPVQVSLTLLDFKLGRGFDTGISSGCSLNESG